MDDTIIFYHSKLCMKCIRVRRIVDEIEKENPNIKIKRIGSLDKLITRKLRTIPALEINNKILYGLEITKDKIMTELKILEDRNIVPKY